MPSIQHIVFPVDFSERSSCAIPFVAEMARRHDARVTLIAVAHPYYGGGMEGAPMIDPQLILDGVKSQLDGVYNTFLSDFAGAHSARSDRLRDCLSRPVKEHGGHAVKTGAGSCWSSSGTEISFSACSAAIRRCTIV